jgi:hypothetical protein
VIDDNKTDVQTPPDTLWLFEQSDDRWMSWSGTEEDLRDFLDGEGIRAYEYKLAEGTINV